MQFCVIAKHTYCLLSYVQVMKASLLSNGAAELYNTLRHHMVNKRLLTKDMKNDMAVESMYNSQGLHINHYSNGVCTFFYEWSMNL